MVVENGSTSTWIDYKPFASFLFYPFCRTPYSLVPFGLVGLHQMDRLISGMNQLLRVQLDLRYYLLYDSRFVENNTIEELPATCIRVGRITFDGSVWSK